MCTAWLVTCLSETIGEDLPGLIRDYKEANKDKELPAFINVSTASYCGSHIDGFHNTLLAAIKSLATDKLKGDYINIFPGFVSPADIRYLKEVLDDFGIKYILFPDYSETLDNEHWKDYQLIPQGGTPLSDIMRTGGAKATIEFGNVFNKGAVKSNAGRIQTAGEWLENEFGVKNYSIGMPIGIKSSDSFFNILSEISQKSVPEKHRKERGRLIDAYVDAHKYVFGKRAMPVALYKEAEEFENELTESMKMTSILVGKFEGICSLEGFGYRTPEIEELTEMVKGMTEIKALVEKRLSEVNGTK